MAGPAWLLSRPRRLLTPEVLSKTLAKYADETTEIGKKAFAAAQDVKTFTQLMDTLKESAQSGWAETWQIVVGDFEEAKKLFTEMSEFFGAMISDSAKARNELLSSAFGSGWSSFLKEGIGDAVGFKESIVNAARAHGVAIEEIASKTEKFEDSLNQGWLSADILSDALADLTKKTAGLSDAELANIGMTRDQVDDLEKLNQAIKDGSVNLEEYANKIGRMSGRENLIQSFRNVLQALFAVPKEAGDLIGVITVIRDAFREIFPPATSEQVYALTEGLRNLTEKLKMSEETADKLKRTCKGLFAIVDIFTTLTGGALKAAIKVAAKLLGMVDVDILDITANVGDAIVAFRDWIDQHNFLAKGIEKALPYIESGIKALRSWIARLGELPLVQKAISRFGNAFRDVSDRFGVYMEGGIKRIKAFIERVKAMDGLTLDNIGKALADFRDNVLSYFLNFGGIFDGLIQAVKDFGSDVKLAFEQLTGGAENAKAKMKTTVVSMLNTVGSAITANASVPNSSMQTVVTSLVEVVKTKTSDVESATASMMTAMRAKIASYSVVIKTAMGSVVSAAVSKINGMKPDFETAGKNAGQGFVNGINSKLSASSAAGRNLGLSALKAAQKALDSHSPSREFEQLGQNTDEGYAKGVTNNAGIVKQAVTDVMDTAKSAVGTMEGPDMDKWIGKVSKSVTEAVESTGATETKVAQQTAAAVKKSSKVKTEASKSALDAFEDYIEEERYYSRITTEEQLAAYKEVLATYQLTAEERKKVAREIYTLEKQLKTDWIEEEKYYNRLSLEDELAAYEQLQAMYAEGTEEYKKMAREVYRLRNELTAASYQNSMDWIEEEKYYNRMSLSDELAAYKRVQSRYAKGTDERKKIDREVYRLEKEISEAQKQYIEDVQKVQSEANQKRLDLEQEYADKVKSINDRLAQDIKSANDQYENALKSRENSLYSSYGLFDAVKEREDVSGDTLMKNLEGQVKEFGEWQDILDSLAGRGLDSELIEELQNMGPSAIAQIKALNSMTDSELEKYASLWSVKHGQAREQAVSELEGLRIETQNNIAQLRADAAQELDEYRAVWQTKMDQVAADANAELEQLQKDFGEKVGLIKTNTEKDLEEMSETAQKILREAGWDETGKQIVAGLTEGVKSERSSFIDELTSMALASVEAIKDTLEINSPSRVTRELGNYTGLGLVKGLRDYADKSYDAGANMAESMKGGLSNAISTISDLMDGDMDMQPTIQPVLDLSNVTKGANELNMGAVCLYFQPVWRNNLL